jgi:hypothetical protein
MRRRAFIAGLASTVFSAPPICRTQQPSRLAPLAVASAVTPVEGISTYSPAYRAFFDPARADRLW